MRQIAAANEKSLPQGIAASRGVLGLSPGNTPDVLRWPPLPELAPYIAHYWRVQWDLRGQPPHTQETAPHPNVYLVFDEGKLVVSGVSTRKFTRVLEGKGRAFGVKFRPGGFHPFIHQPVSSLTDRILPASALFGEDASRLEGQLRTAREDGDLVEAVHGFFRKRIPPPDCSVEIAAGFVEQILLNPEIKTVDDLANRCNTGKRSLQRLFHEYVGIHPKWVIRRYRLHEAVERLHCGEPLRGADLALELGYFDQAHLIRDFKALVGCTPSQYQALCRRAK